MVCKDLLYRGHAVRKNLARELFADAAWSRELGDPWHSMFEAAVEARGAEASDIHPFWVLPSARGSHIERHIMNLPLSIDENRLHDLRRTLAAYRMVFGQPRQEDMLECLLKHVPEAGLSQTADQLRINLEPQE